MFRTLAPVSWHDTFWAVTGYPEAQQVLADSTTFSSAYGTGLISDTEPGLMSLNLSDPPLHTPLRKQVENWLGRANPLYHPTKDPIRDLPRQTLMSLLNIDEQLALRLQNLAIQVARHHQDANQQLLNALAPVACPVRLPQTDQLFLKRLLTLASLESTSAALASLARHRPALPDIEEMLRLHPPIQRFGRHVTRDTRLGAQSIQAGQRVVIFFAAANRDPRIFSEPDQWKRKRPPHLSFGYGPHRCPGQALARRQLHLLQPDPPAPARHYFPSTFSLTPL